MSSQAARPLTGAHQSRESRDWQTGVNGGPDSVAEHLCPVTVVSGIDADAKLNINKVYHNKNKLSSQCTLNRVFLTEYSQDWPLEEAPTEDGGPRPGEERAWLDAALRRIRPRLVRWMTRSARSRVEAEEAVQRAFLVLAERLAESTVALLSRQALESWLFTVALRQVNGGQRQGFVKRRSRRSAEALVEAGTTTAGLAPVTTPEELLIEAELCQFLAGRSSDELDALAVTSLESGRPATSAERQARRRVRLRLRRELATVGYDGTTR